MARDRFDIAFSGYPKAGKTTAATIAANQRGFAVITGSDILLDLASRQQPPLTLERRNDFNSFYREMRLKHGPDFIARTGLNIHNFRVAHDGLRNRADIDTFIAAGGILTGIVCEQRTRFLRKGSGLKDSETFEEFAAADLQENSDDPTGMHVEYALEQAHHTIENNGSLDDFTREVLRVIDLHA